MIRLALTGSIGMGKSTVAKMFERAGVPVFDADAVVRDLQANDPELIEAIGERFAGTVQDGVLDREKLAQSVLGYPDQLSALEAIVHPRVQAAREHFIATNRNAPALLFDIPLLFETGGAEAFDKIVVVSATPEISATTRACPAGNDASEVRRDSRPPDAGRREAPPRRFCGRDGRRLIHD